MTEKNRTHPIVSEPAYYRVDILQRELREQARLYEQAQAAQGNKALLLYAQYREKARTIQALQQQSNITQFAFVENIDESNT